MLNIKLIGTSEFSTKSSEDVIKEIPRFCYRNRFEQINGTKITSDKGWGCCFRSAQGMIAQYVLHLYNENRDVYNATFCQKTNPENENEVIYKEVHPLSLFLDVPGSPFGIQNLVTAAQSIGVSPGEWAKPSTIAAAIKVIFDSLHLSCVISQDFSLNLDKIGQITGPTLLLIPGMFGLDHFDMNFMPFLQLCICANGSLGFVSGKRNSAFFFFGFDSTNFAYFDPHVTKPAVTKESEFSSFFDLPPKLLKTERINPSILVGFFCNSSEHLAELLMVLTACFASPLMITDATELDQIVDQVMDIDDI